MHVFILENVKSIGPLMEVLLGSGHPETRNSCSGDQSKVGIQVMGYFLVSLFLYCVNRELKKKISYSCYSAVSKMVPIFCAVLHNHKIEGE